MVEYSLNLQKIFSHIGGFDALGDSPSQVDTQKEYNLLGQYLNGSYQVEDIDVNKLTKKEKKSLKKLLNQLQQKWGNLTNEKIEDNVVTRENLKEYLNKYNQLIFSPPKNLTEAELQAVKKKVNSALERFMKEIGLPEPYSGDYAFKIKERLRDLDFINGAEKTAQSVLENIQNPISKDILKAKVEEFLTNNNISTNNSIASVDTGDGDFNEVVTQKTNVCWGLAGINTLAQSNVGLSLLENNRHRDQQTGVYAIHLKEAENNELPSGGIYIITPEEIANVSQTIAEGEGDSIAYLLAIDKYFEEIKTCKPEIAETLNVNDIEEGNISSRFFEIITGGTATMIGEFSNVNDELPKGINIGNGISYQQISEIVQSGRGAAVLSVYGGGDDMGHAISVVGTKNGELVIQESNNNKEIFLNTYKDYRGRNIFNETTPINNAPAYTISEDKFKAYTTTRSVLRWE